MQLLLFAVAFTAVEKIDAAVASTATEMEPFVVASTAVELDPEVVAETAFELPVLAVAFTAMEDDPLDDALIVFEEVPEELALSVFEADPLEDTRMVSVEFENPSANMAWLVPKTETDTAGLEPECVALIAESPVDVATRPKPPNELFKLRVVEEAPELASIDIAMSEDAVFPSVREAISLEPLTSVSMIWASRSGVFTPKLTHLAKLLRVFSS